MAEPKDEDVDTILNITCADPQIFRPLIARALREKPGSNDAITIDLLDNPEEFRRKFAWDEDQFGASRDGTSSNPAISFNIQGPDQTEVIHGMNPSSFYAPSRPPSRAANNASPLGRMVNLTADAAAGPADQDDADLQRAMAESLAASGVQSPQEAGITQSDSPKPHFGPATQTDYDQDQWAMVPTAREKPEAGPSDRKRKPGAPAFLRFRQRGPTKHAIGQLLTIYHEIPAARNMFLRLGQPAENYGHNSGWWQGQPILPPMSHVEGQDTDMQEPLEPDYWEEMHRLMAFLDSTDRSYGTADVLVQHSRIAGIWEDPQTVFFQSLLPEDKAALTGGSNPLVTTTMQGAASATQIPSENVDTYCQLELDSTKPANTELRTLYDAWDQVMWPELHRFDAADQKTTNMKVVTKPGPILTMRFLGVGFQRKFELSEKWYLDRYHAEHVAEALEVQSAVRRLNAALEKGAKYRDELTKWRHPDKWQDHDRLDMVKKVIERAKNRLRFLDAAAAWEEHEEVWRETGESFHYDPAAVGGRQAAASPEAALARQHSDAEIKLFESKLATIERKLEKLNEEKELCTRLLHEWNDRYTVPRDTEGWMPQHEYSLRGIVMSDDMVYVCRRTEPDLINLDGPAAEQAAPEEQWWRLGYVDDDAEPVKVEQVTFAEAAEAACSQNNNPILVYANKQAMDEAHQALPDSLQTFVRFDNKLFKQELAQDNPSDRKRSANALPASPSKRQYRSGSIDSMASNRASAGDASDDELRDIDMAAPSFPSREQALVDLSEPEQGDTATARGLEGNNTSDSGLASPTLSRQSLRLQRVSLEDAKTEPLLGSAPSGVSGEGRSHVPDAGARSPEMQERGGGSRMTLFGHPLGGGSEHLQSPAFRSRYGADMGTAGEEYTHW